MTLERAGAGTLQGMFGCGSSKQPQGVLRLSIISSRDVPVEEAAASATSVRYGVLLMLALAATSAYLTRIMSAAATTIQREYGYSSEEIGYILAGFALGYFWFQIPGGWFSQRY